MNLVNIFSFYLTRLKISKKFGPKRLNSKSITYTYNAYMRRSKKYIVFYEYMSPFSSVCLFDVNLLTYSPMA